MPEMEYRGYWWLPEDDSKKIPGTLSFAEHKGKAILNLLGTLVEPHNLLKARTMPLIYGFSESGKQITLYQCSNLGAHLSFPGFSTEKYNVARVFVGGYLGGGGDITFKTVSVSLSNASEWVNVSGIEYTMTASGGDTTLKYSARKVVEVNWGKEWKIEILHRASVQPPKHSLETTIASITERVQFKIESSEEKPFDWFLQKIDLISNFLTLGIGAPVFPLAIDGTTERAVLIIDNVTRYPDVAIFFSMAEDPRMLKNRTWNEMLFAYRHITADFETMIKKWFEKAELLSPVYNLFFGTFYNSSMYLQHEFLSLIQALESYHRRVCVGKYLEDKPYEPIRKTLTERIPADLDSSFKESLKSRLKYGNEFSLRKRLKDVLDRYSKFATGLIDDFDVFISQVVDTRNYLTHYTHELEEKAFKGYDLYVLCQKIKFLIEICFLSELGLSEDSISRRLKEDRRYNHIKS